MNRAEDEIGTWTRILLLATSLRLQEDSGCQDLADLSVDLPSIDEVATGMGEVLAKLHWAVGVDARDVELVLAGSAQHGVQCYLFDFNQVRFSHISDFPDESC